MRHPPGLAARPGVRYKIDSGKRRISFASGSWWTQNTSSLLLKIAVLRAPEVLVHKGIGRCGCWGSPPGLLRTAENPYGSCALCGPSRNETFHLDHSGLGDRDHSGLGHRDHSGLGRWGRERARFRRIRHRRRRGCWFRCRVMVHTRPDVAAAATSASCPQGETLGRIRVGASRCPARTQWPRTFRSAPGTRSARLPSTIPTRGTAHQQVCDLPVHRLPERSARSGSRGRAVVLRCRRF